jgi:hypothetical protein
MATNVLIAPRRGENIIDNEGRATRRLSEYLELIAIIDNQARREVIELGDWNMDTTTNIDVAHGLTYADIISAEVWIRNDADTVRSNISSGVSAANTTPQGYIGDIDATNVNIVRLTTGKFDHVDYDSISYNRGWLIITYKND